MNHNLKRQHTHAITQACLNKFIISPKGHTYPLLQMLTNIHIENRRKSTPYGQKKDKVFIKTPIGVMGFSICETFVQYSKITQVYIYLKGVCKICIEFYNNDLFTFEHKQTVSVSVYSDYDKDTVFNILDNLINTIFNQYPEYNYPIFPYQDCYSHITTWQYLIFGDHQQHENGDIDVVEPIYESDTDDKVHDYADYVLLLFLVLLIIFFMYKVSH